VDLLVFHDSVSSIGVEVASRSRPKAQYSVGVLLQKKPQDDKQELLDRTLDVVPSYLLQSQVDSGRQTYSIAMDVR
jgi:hypothetical protein